MGGKVKLILISGPSGIGKSFIGKALSERMGIPYIDLDTVCEKFLAVITALEGGGRPYDYYARAYRDVCYGTMMGIVVENLRLGVNLVVTAPFFNEMNDPDFFPRLRKENGIDFVSCDVRIIISEEKLHENIVKRGSYRDTAKLENWDAFLSKAHSIRKKWNADVDIPLDKGGENIDEDLMTYLISRILEIR